MAESVQRQTNKAIWRVEYDSTILPVPDPNTGEGAPSAVPYTIYGLTANVLADDDVASALARLASSRESEPWEDEDDGGWWKQGAVRVRECKRICGVDLI